MILIASMAELDSYRNSSSGWGHKIRFEELTGTPALIRHYTQVTPEFVQQYGFRAVFITGFGQDWETIPPETTYAINDVLHTLVVPTLAACGGHQLLGWLFNHDVRRLKLFRNEPLRKLRRDEPDRWPEYHPGYLHEHGVYPIEIVQRDPLFRGLKNPCWMPEAHFCEVKHLPPDFVHLARNENCELQCFRHKDKPLYGAKFHAETWTDQYPDGKTFITNFFRIAGLVE